MSASRTSIHQPVLIVAGLLLVATAACTVSTPTPTPTARTQTGVISTPGSSGASTGIGDTAYNPSANSDTSSALTAAGLLQSAGSGITQATGIYVTGRGAIAATPDVGILSIGIETFAATVAQARDDAARALQSVTTALKSQGVEDKDIQTQVFTVQPEYTYVDVSTTGAKGEVMRQSERRLIGYRVTNTVTAKVHTIDTMGTLIDAAVKAGGDATRVNSVSFALENGRDVETEARSLAITDALAKAQQLAKGSGVVLGKLRFISEVTAPLYGRTAELSASGGLDTGVSIPTPIDPGQLHVTVTVQATFAIGS